MLAALLVYLALGALAGLMAGLFGVGGGIIIVPLVVFSLASAGWSEAARLQHLALGTSFGTIVFTSISSFMAHHRRGAVLWGAVLRFSPGIVLGVAVGGLLASRLRTHYLQLFFVCFLIYVAVQMTLDIKSKSSRDLPGAVGMAGAGVVIGFVSSLVGIGGGTLTVPFLTWCNVSIHKAVGSSAAVGFPIAIVGALTYLVTGWGEPGRPEYSAGFIYLPAMVGISVTSVFTAPLGGRLAHKLPVKRLKQVFAGLLIVMAVRMVYTVFF